MFDRTKETIKISTRNNWSTAMEELNFARANLGLAITKGKIFDRDEFTRYTLTSLDHSTNGLRTASQNDDLPKSLLAQAALHRSVGDWDGSARGLDEVDEIAEPGPMRLYLCDLALERARLAFARIEAFAPLNGLLDGSPPKPEVPQAAECTRLRAGAEEQIGIAAKYIEECGYHRRDEELAELREVLAGKRTFASLPVHV